MPIHIRMTGAELARVRFAVSPVFESVMAVAVLRQPGAHAVHLPWVRWARPRLAAVPDLPLLTALTTQRVYPAFLMPVPDVRMPGFAAELRRVRATDPARFPAYLDRLGPGAPTVLRRLRDDPAEAIARLARSLRRVHDELIAPHWKRMLGVLEADIAYRAGVLADGGTEAVFAGLHREVRWTGDELLLADPRHPHDTITVTLTGNGLVMSPSVFCWPSVWTAIRPVKAGVVRYPARGIATIWESRRPAADALSALVGRTRAELLTLLAEPATTAELAARLGVTPGAVSQHLGVLRRAGLVVTRREGRAVLHLRTGRADALLAP